VVALTDPDPRTNGKGLECLNFAGIATQSGVMQAEARRSMAGWLSRLERGRPFVTLKLATSLDGCIARADGESKWITGEAARAHAHLERAWHEAILVGRGTLEADAPRLDVRLPGLEMRSPQRLLLTRGTAPDGWTTLANPEAISVIDAQYLMVEGGAGVAAAFLRAGLVDRILLYRAPIVIGGGKACLADIGLDRISDAHGQWRCTDKRTLGSDTLEVYEATPCSQA
jgi:diaminohydroxyphosphoribosylaminopyrimidine deaminase / 5-amino-6-(5-phosphoribosylamino)uracil reductase